ncbi:hypothetical protein HDU98_005159, partial [Podochytrium sp. JEL0797]
MIRNFPTSPLVSSLRASRFATLLRPLATRPIHPIRTLHVSRPALSSFDMLTNPFGTIKLKMSKIDHARYAYESCSLQFYENNNFVQ